MKCSFDPHSLNIDVHMGAMVVSVNMPPFRLFPQSQPMTSTRHSSDSLSALNLAEIVKLCSPQVVSKVMCCSCVVADAVERSIESHGSFPMRYECRVGQEGEENALRHWYVPTSGISGPRQKSLPPSLHWATLQVDTGEATESTGICNQFKWDAVDLKVKGEIGDGARYACRGSVIVFNQFLSGCASVSPTDQPFIFPQRHNNLQERLDEIDATMQVGGERLVLRRKFPHATGTACMAQVVEFLPIAHRPSEYDSAGLVNCIVARRGLKKIVDMAMESDDGNLPTVGVGVTETLLGTSLGSMSISDENESRRTEEDPDTGCFNLVTWGNAKTGFGAKVEIYRSPAMHANKRIVHLREWAKPDETADEWIDCFERYVEDTHSSPSTSSTKRYPPRSTVFEVWAIGNDFFAQCPNLVSIQNFAALSSVGHIGDRFLHESKLVRAVDLRGWGNVTSIGAEFLAGCSGIEELDLGCLTRVSHIGVMFLAGCRNLKRVHFESQKDVECCCPRSSQRHVELGLHLLTILPDGFMRDCRSLESISFAPFSRVVSFGSSCFRGCSALTAIDLSPLLSLNAMDRFCFAECHGFEKVELVPPQGLRRVPVGFMAMCNSLGRKAEVQRFFEGFSACTVVGEQCLQNCVSLMSIGTAGLEQVTVIGPGFLQGCSSLTSIDLSGLTSVTRIDSAFLAGCSSIKTIDLAPLAGVATIGRGFMSECTSLEQVELVPLRQATEIGVGLFRGCTKLKPGTLAPLKGLIGSEEKTYKCVIA